MELFVVNRPEVEILANPEKEDRIIENLKKSIEKKRKKRKENENKNKKTKLLEEKLEASVEESNNQTPEESEEIIREAKVVEQAELNKIIETIKQSSGEGFTVLGESNNLKSNKEVLKKVLSHWQAYPRKITRDLSKTQAIDNLIYLTDTMKTNLKNIKITSLFPVQHNIIPWILNSHEKPTPFMPQDICVSAPTGSGKTLAFAIPIVQILQNRFVCKVRALIVLPVQDLARQVSKVFQDISINTGLKCQLLSNSVNFDIEQQMLVAEVNGKYYSKVDIIITTAGRLVQHINSTKGFSLKSLKILVIDEADRILEEIQNDWLYHLNKHVQEESAFIFGECTKLCVHDLWNSKRPPHKLLFSATLTHDPEKLQNLNLFQPILFTTHDNKEILKSISNKSNYDNNPEQYSVPNELTIKYCITLDNLRPLTVYALIKENKWNRFIIFTNKTESAHRLSFVLQKLFGKEQIIEDVSGNINAAIRRNVIRKFISGEITGFICTDAFARGFDVPNLDVVISYDPPRHLKTYIHRIGRTARAGKEGTAITILTAAQLPQFNELIASGNHSKVEEIQVVSNIEELHAVSYKNVLLELKLALEKQKKSKIIRNTTTKVDEQPKKLSLLDVMQSKLKKISEPKSVKAKEHLPTSWVNN